MRRAEAIEHLARARVARFATIGSDGVPHIVPVTFTLIGEAIVHMIDGKPKTTRRLKRLDNLANEPRASLLADHYEDDWDELWWVRVDGSTSVVESGPEWEIARGALADKYPQYEREPPLGPAIYLFIERVVFWAST